MFVGARTAPRGIRGVGGERDVQTSSCVVLPLLFARVMTEVIPPDDELDGKEFFAQWTAA